MKNKVIQNEEYKDFEEEINPILLFNIFLRNKKLISLVTLIGIVISMVFSIFSKKYWEGNFQIVILKNNDSLIDTFFKNIPTPFDFNFTNQESSLKTELEILKSPSVLTPVFEFIRDKKENYNSNSKLKFSSWVEKNLSFELKKGTSVLVLKYKDDNKDLIIPALEKITKRYQKYSGENRRRSLILATNYLEQQVNKYKSKSSESFKKVQEYGIKEDIISDQSFISNTLKPDTLKPDNINEKENQFEKISNSIIGIERVRIAAANKIRKIDSQIKKIEENNNDYDQLQYIGSTIPAFSKTNLLEELQDIENQLAILRSQYQENDLSIQELLKRKTILIKLSKDLSIGFLKADRLETEAVMESATRPEDVLIKYRELLRDSARDEKTLIELEEKYNFIKLESARIEDPWKLITNPTLKETPVEPKALKIISACFIISSIFGYLLAYFYEKKRGLVLEKFTIEKTLETYIIDEINLENKSFKLYDKEIIQKELLEVNQEKKIKVIISDSLSIEESTEALNSIFDKKYLYSISKTLENIINEDRIIFILKINSSKLNEIVSLKKRLDFRKIKLFGVFVINE